MRAGAELALEAAEVDVVVDAGSAGEAIQQLRSRPVDLVVLGAHSDGPAAATIRRLKALLPPPLVLALVERAERADLAELASAGADGLLLRGTGVDELTQSVTRALGGERVLAPALVPSMVGVASRDGSATGPSERPSLTPKELAVLAQLADGRSNREIAEGLYMSPATVKTHLARIYEKLGVTDRARAVARALAVGLLR